MKVIRGQKYLEANERIAEQKQGLVQRKPPSGCQSHELPWSSKTSLLERTIERLRQELRIGVSRGISSPLTMQSELQKRGSRCSDQHRGACHLDGYIIRETFQEFDFKSLDLLIVENVGNLVCPAEFKLERISRL